MEPKEVPRIDPEEARRKVASGEAMLVCGYEGEEKFNTYRLNEAMSYEDFESKARSLDKSKGIIFYCA